VNHFEGGLKKQQIWEGSWRKKISSNFKGFGQIRSYTQLNKFGRDQSGRQVRWHPVTWVRGKYFFRIKRLEKKRLGECK